MASSTITPTRTIAVLIGIAILAVAGFAVVRTGVFEPNSIQGALPGPGLSSPSASVSATERPSASPALTAPVTPTTPAQIKAKNIADAKARLVEYYETTAQVANNGYNEWNKKLDPFWGHPDVWRPLMVSYTELATEGQYTTGVATVEDMRLMKYEQSADVGYVEVSIVACIDFSQVRNFSEDGELIPRQSGAPARYQYEYVMSHPGVDRFWTVYEQVPHPERAC